MKRKAQQQQKMEYQCTHVEQTNTRRFKGPAVCRPAAAVEHSSDTDRLQYATNLFALSKPSHNLARTMQLCAFGRDVRWPRTLPGAPDKSAERHNTGRYLY